jgi:hypothetical protein
LNCASLEQLPLLKEFIHPAAYLFLYPAGHLGLIAVTFLVTLPFTHFIVVFVNAGVWIEALDLAIWSLIVPLE